MRIFIAVFFLSGITNINAQVKKLWETKDSFKAPESVAYDYQRGFIYVSNYNNNVKDGESYGTDCISKITKEGEIVKIDFIQNLTAPTGICIYNDLLFIAERFGVVVYDLKQDKICNRYLVKNTDFLNDITVAPDTSIFISDSGSKVIYRIKSGKVEKWLESDEIANTNGIFYDHGKLILGVNVDNYLKSVDIATKEVRKIALLGDGGIDGITRCGEGYLVSLFKGIILFVKYNGEVKEILNTTEIKLNCADFEYISNEGIIVVPTLWGNKIVSYLYKQ
jgi:hypothetical protein